MRYAIEFRNGSYFVNLNAEHGGPKHLAMTWDTREAAEGFGDDHSWIWFNGGMVVEVKL